MCVKFQLKIPHRRYVRRSNANGLMHSVLYHFENAYFEWKQKQAVLVHFSLNANELLLPTLFPRTGLCNFSLYLRSLPKNSCLVLIIMYIALKSRALKPYQFKFLIYVFLEAHIRSTQAVAARMWVLKVIFHTQVYVKNTLNLQKDSRLCLWS